MELVVVGMRDCCYGWNWWLWGSSLLLRMELVVVGMRDCYYGWNWWLWGCEIAITDGTGGCEDA
jgi:hypothetical protein